MAKKETPTEVFGRIAKTTLSTFAKIAQTAAHHFSDRRRASPEAFATVNTLNEHKAVRSLASIHDSVSSELQLLTQEPAIARIVAQDEDGKNTTYYISRGAAPAFGLEGAKLASYRSAFGRIASSRRRSGASASTIR